MLKKCLSVSALLSASLLLSSCQVGYLVKSGYNQMKLLQSRVPLQQALQDPNLSESDKQKLRLAEEARQFAEQDLHLKATKNYTTFVDLKRPYVTYVVSAAPRWTLKHYQWSYPFMGKMPYKGYFNEDDAKDEEQDLKKQDLDTYLRGVSAYSTLGYFNDPILSSMLRYTDYDLVNTIIHETVHATLYIKHAADFNERFATFLGNKGAEMFYLKKEGPESKTLAMIKKENEDHKVFSEFISAEIKSLEQWYKDLSTNEQIEEKRMLRISEIQKRFRKDIQPRLKTDSFTRFADLKLNNARLLIYKTYMQDLEDFEKLYQKEGSDFQAFMKRCLALENAKDPEKELKNLISSH